MPTTVLEAVWATALGTSDGLSRPWPTVTFVGALALSMAGLARDAIETVSTMGVGKQRRDRRVVWQYSRKREKRDNITLDKQIDRAKQISNGTRPAKKDSSSRSASAGPGRQ